MFVFPGVNIETAGVSLIGNTISDFATKDQTTALHVVKHDVFKNWCEFFVVYEVEEYFLICSDVYSDVSFDEVKKTFMLKFEILSPVPFFGFIVINSLEEQNVT